MSFGSIARTYTLLDGVQLLLRRPNPPLTIFSTQLTTGNPRSSIVNLKLSHFAQEWIDAGALRGLVGPGTVIVHRLVRCEMQSDVG